VVPSIHKRKRNLYQKTGNNEQTLTENHARRTQKERNMTHLTLHAAVRARVVICNPARALRKPGDAINLSETALKVAGNGGLLVSLRQSVQP